MSLRDLLVMPGKVCLRLYVCSHVWYILRAGSFNQQSEDILGRLGHFTRSS